MGAHSVHVVFQHVDHWKVPEGHQVHGFVERSLIDRAVSEEADTYLVGVPVLDGKSDPGCERHPASDDAMAAQEARADVEHVHRAAFSFGYAGRLAEKLCHDVLGVGALGDALSVLPIRAHDVVVRPKRGDESYPDCFLACVQVQEAADFALRVHLGGSLLECPDQQHLPVHVEQLVLPENESFLTYGHCS